MPGSCHPAEAVRRIPFFKFYISACVRRPEAWPKAGLRIPGSGREFLLLEALGLKYTTPKTCSNYYGPYIRILGLGVEGLQGVRFGSAVGL